MLSLLLTHRCVASLKSMNRSAVQQEKRLQEEGGEPLEEVQPDIARVGDEQVQAICASHPILFE